MTTTTMIKLPRSPWSLPSPLSLSLLELRLKKDEKFSLWPLVNVQPAEIALAAVRLSLFKKQRDFALLFPFLEGVRLF